MRTVDAAEMSVLIERYATLSARRKELDQWIDREGRVLSDSRRVNPASKEKLAIDDEMREVEREIGIIGPLNRHELGPAETARRTRLWNQAMRLRGEPDKVMDEY